MYGEAGLRAEDRGEALTFDSSAEETRYHSSADRCAPPLSLALSLSVNIYSCVCVSLSLSPCIYRYSEYTTDCMNYIDSIMLV